MSVPDVGGSRNSDRFLHVKYVVFYTPSIVQTLATGIANALGVY